MPTLVGYAQAQRHLTVHRFDASVWSQLLTVAAAPLAMLLSAVVLRPLRWYAMATCLRTGWGSRQQVEVTLGQPTPRAAA